MKEKRSEKREVAARSDAHLKNRRSRPGKNVQLHLYATPLLCHFVEGDPRNNRMCHIETDHPPVMVVRAIQKPRSK